jgi:ATP-dependent helicase IRC3
MHLRNYQTQALEAILEAEKRDIRRSLVVIPTGGGKTVIFSHLPIIRPNSTPMLVLAHREELLDQAKEKILIANPDLVVEIEQGARTAGRVDVVVASVATLGRANSKRIEKYPRDYFKVIITDEAHHAAAPSYGRIYDYFQGALSIGVTATPQRGDKIRLTDVFDEVVYFKSILEMMEDGWLSSLVGYRVKSNTDITDIKTRAGDYDDGALAEAVDNEDRNNLIVKSYKELLDGEKTIVFCASVKHAEDLNDKFNQHNIAAAVIIGTTPSEERKEIRAKFRSGEIKVICNVAVLTEGFDEPSVTGIIIARPTQSHLLYTQIVGRGTRIFEGKEHCKIIDIADVTKGKKPVGLPSLLGMPPDFELDGKDVREAYQKFKEVEEIAPTRVVNAKTFEELEVAIEQVNLFLPPPPNEELLAISRLTWIESGAENYLLNIDGSERIHVWQDPLGNYRARVELRGRQDTELGILPTIEAALSTADNWALENRKDKLALLDTSAPWRVDQPTEKQMKFLKSKGLPIPPDITKGMATQIIQKWIESNPRSIAQQKAIEKSQQAKRIGF